jgi:hypothetical protein
MVGVAESGAIKTGGGQPAFPNFISEFLSFGGFMPVGRQPKAETHKLRKRQSQPHPFSIAPG